MAVLLLFAAAREAAGTGRDEVEGATVGEVLDEAQRRYGDGFAAVLERCKVWRNGDEARLGDEVADGDEVAVLPPVSGGAGRSRHGSGRQDDQIRYENGVEGAPWA